MNDKLKRLLGNSIKSRLDDLSKTPKELANHCEVKSYIIYRWIEGVSYPSYPHLFKVCNFLNCSIPYLLQKEDKIGFSTNQARLLSLMKERLGLLHLKIERLRKEVPAVTSRIARNA